MGIRDGDGAARGVPVQEAGSGGPKVLPRYLCGLGLRKRVFLTRRSCLRTTCGTPAFAVFADPIQQGPFEAYVIAESLRLQPFMAENLFPLGEELLVEARRFYEFTGGLEIFRRQTHFVGITEADIRELAYVLLVNVSYCLQAIA